MRAGAQHYQAWSRPTERLTSAKIGAVDQPEGGPRPAQDAVAGNRRDVAAPQRSARLRRFSCGAKRPVTERPPSLLRRMCRARH